ncbi:Retrotransposon protein, Ty3-gypsy subclass [Gossypium australe]|uniref:Retrotransposon protein, Ty3-gypsy subclass n=1 Tax=Gossypium australe TaxID=47621 RepID=A0A5B6VL28_9ROSI|nr:Retrotransposon protein, Ty3-gypsy subclass [Gossypium australe]
MDFVSGLLLSLKNKDVIWVVVDRLTKSTHFIPLNCTLLRSLDCTGCQFRLFRIKIRGLHRDFERNCKKLWSLKEIGRNIYCWRNFHITTAFNRV